MPDKLYIICTEEKSWLEEAASPFSAVNQWWDKSKPKLEYVLELYVLEFIKSGMSIEDAATDPRAHHTYKYDGDFPDESPRLTKVGEKSLKNPPSLGESQGYNLDDVLILIEDDVFTISYNMS